MLKLIIIFLSGFLLANCCRAVVFNNNDFRQYGFTTYKNTLIERALWGYKLRYSKKSPDTYAYVLGKIPRAEDFFSAKGAVSFSFRARLYPVAPNTQHLRRVIKAYIKKTQRSFPIQYSKRSTKFPETDKKKEGVTLLFRDTRLLPLNLFRNYDAEVVFDYRNRIVSFNCNGNKVILKDNFIKVWKYFGLATLFSTVGYNKNTIIALEYEFSSIKICRNVNRFDSEEKQAVFKT